MQTQEVLMQKLEGLPDKKYFRCDEAAEFFRRDVRTIYRWCRDGKLHHIRVGGRGLLIPRTAMADVIRLSSECYI